MIRTRKRTNRRARSVLAVGALVPILLTGPAYASGAAIPDLGSGDTEVTVGSGDARFSGNKQNEPGVAINPFNPKQVASGANDNIDLEDCSAGDPKTCPFTPGVGVSGVQLSSDGARTWTQPTYEGLSARHCTTSATCTVTIGQIGTLPGYSERGMVSNGDANWSSGPSPERTAPSRGRTGSGSTTPTS